MAAYATLYCLTSKFGMRGVNHGRFLSLSLI